MKEYFYYLAGEFKSSSEKIKVISPYAEEEFALFFETPKEELDFCIKKAKIAQRSWQGFSFKERAKILREIAQVILENLNTLAELETKEIGKPLKESLFIDVPLCVEVFNYYAGFLENLEENIIENNFGWNLIKYEPYGLCAVYLPYNVPLMIFGFSCATALAAGNALLIKPSEFASLSMLELAKHLDKLDIPKGLINILTGRGEIIGKALAASEIDLISFTGSLSTLKKIIPQIQNYPKKIICELGGCNLAVVFQDADKNKALENILASCFIKAGQMCIGTSLILIEEDIYQEFIKEFIEKTKRIRLGDPFDPQTNMGPLISESHLIELDKKVKSLTSLGVRVLCGGEIKRGKGFFYLPTVLELKETIYEELFGPVVMVKSFKKEQIHKIIQEYPYGLVMQIWTENLTLAQELANLAKVGTVWINTFAQISSQTPFGGKSLSGWGRNLGKFGFFEYIQPKHIGLSFGKTPVEGWFGL